MLASGVKIRIADELPIYLEMNSTKHFEVLILGGGVAGITAGIWSADLGMSSAIIDRGTQLGGQLLNVFNPISNYPGANFANGEEMRDRLVQQLQDRKVDLLLNSEVVEIDVERRHVRLADGESISAEALIIATGVRRRKLGVRGENEFCGRGMLDSGAKNPTRVENRRVIVVGGGDAALENAIILSQHAQSVLLVHRRAEFSARNEFVSKVLNDEKIEVAFNSEVAEFVGTDQLNGAEMKDKASGAERTIKADFALIRIGFEPNSELFRESVKCDESGYVIVDRDCRTSVSNIYAIGDICRPKSQTLASAAGDGIASAVALYRNSAF